MPVIDYFLHTDVEITKASLLEASEGIPEPHLELHKDSRTWNKDRLAAMELMLCNLVWSQGVDAGLFYYSRGRVSIHQQFNPVGVKIHSLLSCVDSLAAAGFIDHTKGRQRTEGSKRTEDSEGHKFYETSTFRATSKALKLCSNLGLTREAIQEYRRFHVRLRPEGRGDLVPYKHDAYSAHIEALMADYCNKLNQHRISVPSNDSTEDNLVYLEYGKDAQPIHLYRNYREYTKKMEEEIGDRYPFIDTNWNFVFGGRSGGYWHGTKKELRPYIKIDGKPVEKVDMPCCHINLCYRNESKTNKWYQTETYKALKAEGREQEDAYYLPNVERDVVKKIVLIMFNVKGVSGAKNSVHNWINHKYEDKSRNATAEELQMYRDSVEATGKKTEKAFNDWVIKEVLRKHHKIKGYFLKGLLAGQIVQGVESNFMHHLAAYFQSVHGFCCFTVYDEFIIPADDWAGMVEEQMFSTMDCDVCTEYSILNMVKGA